MDFDQIYQSANEAFSKVALKLSWGARKRNEFYLLMENFVRDGIPVYDAVEDIGKRWADKKDARRLITDSILEDLRGRGGRALRFGQAIQRWVPTIEAMAIDAGEQAGSIPDGLLMAARMSDVSSRIKATIFGQLAYPAILLLVLMGLLLGLQQVVMPVFSELIPRETWPVSARRLSLVADNAEIIAGGFVSFLIGVSTIFGATRGRWVGQARDFFDAHVPPWSISRKIASAIMMTSFSSLIKAGIPFSAVLSKLSATASPWEIDHLRRMRLRMREGTRDSEAMASELFDDDVRWEIGVYGRLTGFADALEKLSTRVSERVIKNITAACQIVYYITLAMVAFTMLWSLMSFFDISNTAKSVLSQY